MGGSLERDRRKELRGQKEKGQSSVQMSGERKKFGVSLVTEGKELCRETLSAFRGGRAVCKIRVGKHPEKKV